MITAYSVVCVLLFLFLAVVLNTKSWITNVIKFVCFVMAWWSTFVLLGNLGYIVKV